MSIAIITPRREAKLPDPYSTQANDANRRSASACRKTSNNMAAASPSVFAVYHHTSSDGHHSEVMIFHGTHDEFVPITHSRELARASTRARFVEIPGATHNDIPMAQLREELDALMSRIEQNTAR